MNTNNQWLKQAKQLCAQIGPEDGVDPRLTNRGYHKCKRDYKTQQLCREAQRMLSLTLGEMHSSALEALDIVEVIAEGNGEFLRIIVATNDLTNESDELKIINALQQAEGYLRSIIAQSVKRKRIPALRFSVVNAAEEGTKNAYTKSY